MKGGRIGHCGVSIGNAGFQKGDAIAILGDVLAQAVDFGVERAYAGAVLAFEFVQCRGKRAEFRLQFSDAQAARLDRNLPRGVLQLFAGDDAFQFLHAPPGVSPPHRRCVRS